MILRLFFILLSAAFFGGLTYAACVIWPFAMDGPTALIAAFSIALGWALVAGVFADSRQNSDEP